MVSGPVLGSGGILRAAEPDRVDLGGRHRGLRGPGRPRPRLRGVGGHGQGPPSPYRPGSLPGVSRRDAVVRGEVIRSHDWPWPSGLSRPSQLFPDHREPDVGTHVRPGDRRPGGRLPFYQPADSPGVVGRAGPGLRRERIRSQAPAAAHRQVPHLSALGRSQRHQPERCGQLFASGAPGSGRGDPPGRHLRSHGSSRDLQEQLDGHRSPGHPRHSPPGPGPLLLHVPGYFTIVPTAPASPSAKTTPA